MPKKAPAFSNEGYLLANPDVAAAVRAGIFRSGHHHWRRRGRREGRSLAPPPPPPLNRRDILLGGLDLATMTGLEIGALTAPLVTKADGHILYVDHADTDTLRRKYGRDEIDHGKLVEVDLVWGERTLADCLGPGRTVDYVVNSHVVEHVPDLVTWLREIAAVLKPGGDLRMAIPDRRYTFDILRRESTLADALDAFIRRARVPLPRAILDHFLHVTEVDADQAWAGTLPPDLRPTHSAGFALAVARRCHETGEYQDTHCWVFTPSSFVALCRDLADLGLLPFACCGVVPTRPGHIEFFARLRACADAKDCAATWHAEAARIESAEHASP